eukprot:scaffold1443_cov116-Isochrysis_galbana.AAC.9
MITNRAPSANWPCRSSELRAASARRVHLCLWPPVTRHSSRRFRVPPAPASCLLLSAVSCVPAVLGLPPAPLSPAVPRAFA